MYGSAKDASPAASPIVITPGVDTGIPQYPTAYNGDTAADIETAPITTELSPTPHVEPALPERPSESDNSTVKEPVCSLLCIFS